MKIKLPLTLFVYSLLTPLTPALGAEKNLELPSDIGSKVTLLKTDLGTACSGQFVKLNTPAACGAPKSFYKFLTADHCLRPQKDRLTADQSLEREASLIQVFKNTKNENSCVLNPNFKAALIESPENGETLESLPTASEDTESEFLRLIVNRSRFEINNENFTPILTIKIKDVPKESEFAIPKGNTKRQFQTPTLRVKGKVHKTVLTEEQENFAFVGTNEGAGLAPAPIQFQTASPLLKVKRANSNPCTDQLQVQSEKKWLNDAQIEAFELANAMPALNETVSLLGFQQSCNPTKIECTYSGVSSTRLGAQHVVRCENLKSAHFKGMSGGAVVNKDGRLLGLISQQEGPLKGSKTKSHFAFSPTLDSMVSCDGDLKPFSGTLSYPGYTDKGKVIEAPVIAQYEAPNGCYKEDSLQHAPQEETLSNHDTSPKESNDKSDLKTSATPTAASATSTAGAQSFSSESPATETQKK